MAETKLNIYQKLNKCRVELHSMDIKQSGENKFAGYKYFELGDFLPVTTSLFADNGLIGITAYTTEQATLTIVDVDNPTSTIVFTSPMAAAELKGCHPIQNLGAVQSYQRRYLYMAAMEISESDALDSTSGKEEKQQSKPQAKPQPKPTDKISIEQLNSLYTLADGKAEQAKVVLEKHGYKNSKEIQVKDYDKICKEIGGAA